MSGEAVRTLFVTGLSHDATERELYLLFRNCPGFEGGILKLNPPKQPCAFVTFDSADNAEAARFAVDGVVFDPASEQRVRILLANSNSKKREDSSAVSEKRFKTEGVSHMVHGYGPKYNAGQVPMGHKGVRYDAGMAHYGYPPMHGMHGHPGVTPSSTLFVAGVGQTSTLEDVDCLFSTQMGYTKSKLKDEGTPRACSFIQFTTPEEAQVAMSNLNGRVLDKISGQTLRIEFSRSNMKA